MLKPWASEKFQSALFLHMYCSYLISEQQAEEERHQNGDFAEKSIEVNKSL